MVYEVVRLIPRGRVTSYGAIARYLGTAGSSRMVGWAMNGAHREKPPVPAQGVRVDNDQIADFKKHFWDPSEEL